MIAGGGAIFLWSAIEGKSWSTVLRNIISGKSPQSAANVNAITAGAAPLAGGTGNPSAAVSDGGAIGGGTITGQALANEAMTGQGHAYLYGGAPGPNGTNPWDCSSACNWWQTRVGLPIPGGAWNPSTHGPATGSYLSWGSGISSGQVGAGDLCVWATHMGVAINNTQMISALDPALGTAVTGILAGGPPGETVSFRRVT